MSDDLTCPTCGSANVPTVIRAAIDEAGELSSESIEIVSTALESLYMRGLSTEKTPPNQLQHWEQTLRKIIGHLSPRTELALNEFGPDVVWKFFKARFVT